MTMTPTRRVIVSETCNTFDVYHFIKSTDSGVVSLCGSVTRTGTDGVTQRTARRRDLRLCTHCERADEAGITVPPNRTRTDSKFDPAQEVQRIRDIRAGGGE